MQELRSAVEFEAWREAVAGRSVGFVPTMGALHAGHAALVRRARLECEAVVGSIFVNPLQFDDPGDLERYPQTLTADLALLAELGVDAVFLGSSEDLYPRGFQSRVVPEGNALPLEGEGRAGHFAGVATIVLKLLLMARPERAYFGEKDWQQLQVVTALARDYRLGVEIVPCPTVREADGLALSSRNLRLAPVARAEAPVLARALSAAARLYAGGERDGARLEGELRRVLRSRPVLEVEYAVVAGAASLRPWEQGGEERPRALIAARLGGVRLIDNAALDEPPILDDPR